LEEQPMLKSCSIVVIVMIGILWHGLSEAVPHAVASTALTEPARSLTGAPAPVTTGPPQHVEHAALDMRSARLFRRLEDQFNGGWLGPYQIIRSDAKKGTMIVRRDSIDNASLAKWCYCQVDTLNMLDSLRNGAVFVTLTLTPDRNTTGLDVADDFEGTYSLTPASATTTVRCASQGVLEKELVSTIVARNPHRTPHLARR
jgi:hypothetical protein